MSISFALCLWLCPFVFKDKMNALKMTKRKIVLDQQRKIFSSIQIRANIYSSKHICYLCCQRTLTAKKIALYLRCIVFIWIWYMVIRSVSAIVGDVNVMVSSQFSHIIDMNVNTIIHWHIFSYVIKKKKNKTKNKTQQIDKLLSTNVYGMAFFYFFYTQIRIFIFFSL